MIIHPLIKLFTLFLRPSVNLSYRVPMVKCLFHLLMAVLSYYHKTRAYRIYAYPSLSSLYTSSSWRDNPYNSPKWYHAQHLQTLIARFLSLYSSPPSYIFGLKIFYRFMVHDFTKQLLLHGKTIKPSGRCIHTTPIIFRCIKVFSHLSYFMIKVINFYYTYHISIRT